MCSAIASCCLTKRCPRACPPTGWSRRSWRRFPHPRNRSSMKSWWRKGKAEGAQAAQPAAGQTAPSAENVLKRLEWKVIRRLDGLLQGDYRTLMRGAGLDLADLREYQHHDDVRHIDWNVTARMQIPHV